MAGMQTEDRLPPHCEKMERAVLGCILEKAAESLAECHARFKSNSEAFYDPRNRAVFRAALELNSNQRPVDLLTVHEHLKSSGRIDDVGGLPYLMELQNDVETILNIGYYADVVTENYMQRQILAACVEAGIQVYDTQKVAGNIISGVERKLQSIRELRADSVVIGGAQSGQLLTSHLERRFNLQGAKSGVVTGLHDLDRITDGLQFGEQTIIGARPSQGKTALATTIIYKACLIDKQPTLVVTLEMSVETPLRRVLANYARIPIGRLRSGNLQEADFAKIATFNDLLGKSPIYFMDATSGTDISQICVTIKRLAKDSGLKLAIIDYLQKIKSTGSHEKRTYEVAQVSGALKSVAVASGVALLTLAQLNREPEQNKGRPPRLSDLADSGQIERDGDCIALLERNREQGQGHEARLHVAKQRDGEIGVVDLHFKGEYCVFENKSNSEIP